MGDAGAPNGQLTVNIPGSGPPTAEAIVSPLPSASTDQKSLYLARNFYLPGGGSVSVSLQWTSGSTGSVKLLASSNGSFFQVAKI